MKVRMYVCGPTVYDFIHIGNARPMIVFDSFRRFLTFMGYDVNYVSNFTDIDDKIIKRANETNSTQKDVAEKYIVECKKDMESMNILPATTHPKATEEIQGMIDLISKLIDAGYAYVGTDGTVYFDTTKPKDYGKLSHKNMDDLMSGFRDIKVTGEESKKTSTDFVLWKPKKEGEPYWESPWCDGRPGWHTECVVMAPKYCGGALDIHAGGEDLVFPHHENEIAQYEAINEAPFSRYWMHNAFLNINNQKMSKSLGNFFTVRDIVSKFEGKVLRLFMLSTHYRAMLNFSFELMEQGKNALDRITTCMENLKFLSQNKEIKIGKAEMFVDLSEMTEYLIDMSKAEELTDSEREVVEKVISHVNIYIDKLNDDFNTADAITEIFELVRLANTYCKSETNTLLLNCFYQVIYTLSMVLGIDVEKKEESLDSEIEKLIEERTKAKKDKDFAKADSIRKTLLEKGIELEDTREGVKWHRV
ncbi:MAG: cysteine--tRNA ligase [Lachnospiraceae bacterium]|nr:cysteine--tRNA ligase [Lachnospiraceae bacterium]